MNPKSDICPVTGRECQLHACRTQGCQAKIRADLWRDSKPHVEMLLER